MSKLTDKAMPQFSIDEASVLSYYGHATSIDGTYYTSCDIFDDEDFLDQTVKCEIIVIQHEREYFGVKRYSKVCEEDGDYYFDDVNGVVGTVPIIRDEIIVYEYSIKK